MKRYTFTLILSLLCLLVCKQSLAQTFNLPAEVCPGENITFTSPQPTASRHQWDFCTGDLLQPPDASLVVNPITGGLSRPEALRLVRDIDNNLWRLFVSSVNTNLMLRYDLNDDFEIVNSQQFSIGFTNCYTMDFLKDGNNWYAMVARNISGPLLLRFGNSLANVPTSTLIADPLGMFPNPYLFQGSCFNVKIIKHNNNFLAFLPNSLTIPSPFIDDTRLNIINFGNSLENPITLSNVLTTPNITTYVPNRALVTGYDMIQDGANWFGLAIGDNRVTLLNFGNNPNSLPTTTNITANIVGYEPTWRGGRLELERDGNNFIAIFINLNGDVVRLNFGNSMNNTAPILTKFGNFGLLGSQVLANRPSFALTIAQQGSEWCAFATNRHPNIDPPFNQHQLIRLKFPNTCNANIATSSATNSVVNYVLPGNYAINLRTFDTNGNFDKIYTDNLTVKQATVGNFTFTNQCLGENTIFNNLSIGGDATVGSWEWDFGDGSPKSNLRSPIYKYPRAGIFNASLKVTNTTGCVNTTTKPLIVSSRPKPDFTTQSGTCLAEPVTFRDLSTWQPITPVITYLWDFGDGVGVLRGNASDATTRNPSYTYNAPGIYNVTLSLFEGNPTNCAGSISRQIVVAPKPVANFNFTNLCVNAPTQFTDASTLVGNWNDNIVAWDWNFSGRGTSKERNPRFIFTATGTFNVTLTATTRYGCQHTITRSLTIQPSATSSFTTDITQGNAPLTVRFNNTSVGASTYLWEFGDGNTSTQPSLTYTFNKQGVYDVGFQARGANGCGTIATRQITVFAPLLDITLNNLLVNEQGEMTVNIVNKSSFPLTEINLQIKIGQNNEVMQEIWQGFILPTKEQTYTLKKKVTAEQISQNAFICLTASTVNQLEDTNVSDNTACFKILQSFEVLGFSPIPADNLITINYYIPDDTKPVELKVFSSVGALVRTYTLPVQVKDTNFYYFDANYLSNGVYYFHFLHNGNRIVKKAMIFR